MIFKLKNISKIVLHFRIKKLKSLLNYNINIAIKPLTFFKIVNNM